MGGKLFTAECVGCLNIWNDETCVKEHVMQKIRSFFCLNCDDWIVKKEKVNEQGWRVSIPAHKLTPRSARLTYIIYIKGVPKKPLHKELES